MRLLASAFAVLALAAGIPAASGAERPNIVFIFSDDHALNAISAYGGRLKDAAPTPNIDRLAKEGAVFTRSYCGNSICGPSRATVLTGKHSALNGFVDNDGSRFDSAQVTFPGLLQQAGYQTAVVGKWHLVTKPVGFDYWEIMPAATQGSYYRPAFASAAGTHEEKGYATDLITDKAIQWMEKRDPSKPFMLMCQNKAPHRNWMPATRHLKLFDGVTLPEPDTLFDGYADRSATLAKQRMSIAKDFSWNADMKFTGPNLFPEKFTDAANGEYARLNPEEKAAYDAAYEPENAAFIADLKAGKLDDQAVTRWKYQRYLKDYLRCVRAVDENVGRLLDYLDKSGLAKNTVVIYCSDQGFYLGEHGWYDKRWMFEESLAMPFLIRWPGVVKPGVRNPALIQNIDYAPTFLEMAGAKVPEEIQGRSLVPVLKAGDAPTGWRDAIYYYYSGEGTHAVAAHDGVRTDRYKLMWFPGTKEWNLFDLEEDPHEMKSVHDDPTYADDLAKLRKRYDELKAQYGINPATTPAARPDQAWWRQRHQAKLKEASTGRHDLVFIGDSITQGWEGPGKALWDQYYAGLGALNLGFSGDHTENVLWRLMNGELDGVDPKAFVVMIGTNNTGHRQDPAADTALGIHRIVSLLRERRPKAKIVLVDIFPRGATPNDKLRKLNDDINGLIRKEADGQQVIHVDLKDKFLTADGTLPKTLMPDLLHPQAEGYRLWAETLEPVLAKLGLPKSPAPVSAPESSAKPADPAVPAGSSR